MSTAAFEGDNNPYKSPAPLDIDTPSDGKAAAYRKLMGMIGLGAAAVAIILSLPDKEHTKKMEQRVNGPRASDRF